MRKGIFHMIKCWHCQERAELLISARTVAPKTPVCERHAREVLRANRGNGIVSLRAFERK